MLGFPSSREWRNWQTRWLQVPVFERMWGFKSPLAHSGSIAKQDVSICKTQSEQERPPGNRGPFVILGTTSVLHRLEECCSSSRRGFTVQRAAKRRPGRLEGEFPSTVKRLVMRVSELGGPGPATSSPVVEVRLLLYLRGLGWRGGSRSAVVEDEVP